jgi:tetratricopeptide (TPR) repeat protein
VDKLGDLFYTFGTDEAKERGVKEWRIAFNAAGASRREIGKKLADHYIRVGEVLLAKGSKPGATDEDLPNALNAFTQALEFDQSNEVAATRLNETNVAISERKERRQLNVNIIASAEKVMVQAEKSRIAGDFGNAITTYNQALGLFQAVDNEFTDQAETAKESVKEISKNITDVINQILDAASDAIDKGDKLVDEKKFEEAQKLYETVPGVVSVVPGDVNTTHGKDRESLVETSKNKIKDAKLAKQRYEKQKADQEEAAKRLATQGGPRPAAAPAAPATPAPAAPLAPISK